MAIEIKIKNTALVLDPDFEATLERESSLFSYDVVKDAITIGTQIPVDGNEKALGVQARIGLVDRVSIFPCTIQKKGLSIPDARLLIEKIDEQFKSAFISCSIILTGVGAELLDKRISDFDLGTYDLDKGDLVSNAGIIQSTPDPPFCFPTYFNPKHYGSSNPEFGPNNADGLAFINRYEAGFYVENDATDRSLNALSPWPFLIHVLRKIFGSFGYQVAGNLWDDEMQRLVIQSNLTLDRYGITDGFEVFAGKAMQITDTDTDLNMITTIEDPGSLYDLALDEFTLGTLAYFEIQISGEYLRSVSFDSSPFVRFSIKADGLPIGEFDSSFMNVADQWTPFTATVAFQVTDITDIYTIEKKYISTIGQTFDQFDLRDVTMIVTNTSSASTNVYDPIVNVNEHVPQVKVKALLVGLRKLIGCSITFDPFGRQVKFDKGDRPFTSRDFNKMGDPVDGSTLTIEQPKRFLLRNKLAADSFDTMPAASWYQMVDVAQAPFTPFADRYVLETSTSAVYLTEDDGGGGVNYILQGYLLATVEVGTEGDQEEIESDIELIPMQNYDTNEMTGASDAEHLWFIPSLDETGSSKVFSVGINTHTKLRLAIWHGIYDDGHRQYPLATSFNRDRVQATPGDISLAYKDENGGVMKWHRPVLLARINEELVEKEFIQGDTTMRGVDLSLPVVVDGKKYLIRSAPLVVDRDDQHILKYEMVVI